MEISIQRIWLLSRKQWVDHQKMYLLGILAMAGIMMVIFLLFTNPDFNRRGLTLDMQGTFFFIGLIFFGAIFTSTLFNHFAEKPTGIHVLMLPASMLEKTIFAILYSNVVFPLVYVLFVYPILIFAHFVDLQVQGNLNELFNFNYEVVWGFSIVCLLVLNVTLLCSILFRRYTFIKTAILACILFFGFIYLNQKMAHAMVGDNQQEASISTPKEPHSQNETTALTYNLQNAVPFYSMGFFASDRSSFISIKLPKQQTFIYNFIIYGFIIVLLWSATWFRLREKQM